jgi:Pyruvate/2-oxoacid:ferredoxin oxidoreductase delta subunit
MKCANCKYDSYPPCAIKEILTASTLEDTLTANDIKRTRFPVCHVNAQRLVEKTIIKTDSCTQCGLCDILCEEDTVKPTVQNYEEVVFSSLSRFNILFSTLLPDCIVASEVKAKGNSRVKRIDVTIKHKKCVYLIKILSDANKIPYYSRSYKDTVDCYSKIYPQIKFKHLIVIPSNKIDILATDEHIHSIETLIKKIKET